MTKPMRIPEDFHWPEVPEDDTPFIDKLRFTPPTHLPSDQDEDTSESVD